MTNKYIQYENYLNKVNHIKTIKAQGIKLLYSKNRFKTITGSFLIGVGIITLPIPTGSIFLIGAGFMLLNIGRADLYLYKEKNLRKIKNKLRGF